MIDDEILKLLQQAVGAAVAASTIPAMQIKAVGVTTAPQDPRYLELVHIPNNRNNDYWGTSRVYQGSLRVILHWPNSENSGAYPPMQYLKQIANAMPKGRALRQGTTVVQIYENPDFTGAIEAGAETIFPVVISYRCFSL